MKRTISRHLLPILFMLMHAKSHAQVKSSCKVYAPDKTTCMEIGVSTKGKLVYRVLFAGRETVSWSALGFVVDHTSAGEMTVIKNKKQKSNREKFACPLGEEDTVTNNYNQLELSCATGSLTYNLMIRVFDGSVAFRYILPAQPGVENASIHQENTGFIFPGSYSIYQYNQESVFTPVSIDTLDQTCDFPATLVNGKLFISIGEACNENYTKAELKKGTAPHSLAIAFRKNTSVKPVHAYQMPWRTISISTTAVGLHQFSTLNLKLSPPATKEIPASVKPGKLIRAQLNTQSGLDCIEFAVKHHFQYILFDAGWYGAEFRSTSDPTLVIPAIDMPQVIRHAKDNGIGVILYVNYVGLRARLDTLLPLYKSWGVAGLKFGFVDGLTQDGIAWLVSAIQKVNDYGFILDIHDNYKPTGLSRTYPALLTQEGVRGDENSPDAFHNTLLPFTRFLAGPADFTFCFPNENNSYSKNLKVSKAQQLALSVVYFSPLQSIFWYGLPKEYTNENEINFFTLVPTVWNESHYLSGAPGRYISVARRHGTTWYIGNAAGPEDWKQNLALEFLTPQKNYTATIYEDDGLGSIRKRTLIVKKGDIFSIDIKAKGGQAIMIELSVPAISVSTLRNLSMARVR